MIYKYILLFFVVSFSYSQNNNYFDYGNGTMGDSSVYTECLKLCNKNSVPFSYDILHRDFNKKISEINLADCSGLWHYGDFQISFDQNYITKEVLLGNEAYNIQKLLRKYSTTFSDSYPVVLQSISKLVLKDKEYIILCVSYDSNLSAYNSLSFTLAFEMRNNAAKILEFKTSCYSSALCYDDYDNDGNIDYLYLNGCKTALYTFKNDRLQLNKSVWLSLKCFSDGFNDVFTTIDLKKSNWNSDLRVSWKALLENRP